MTLRHSMAARVVVAATAFLICIAAPVLMTSCGKRPPKTDHATVPRKSVTVLQSETPILSMAQQDTLLAIARRAIAAYLKDHTMPPPPVPADETLRQHRGCMVKLLGGAITRGTSGYLLPIKPLAAGAAEMAVKATIGNQKTGPVTLADLDSITIELSVISDPTPVERSTDVLPGVHGLLVSRGESVGGILLPGEVAQIANPDSAIGTLLGLARSTRGEWKNKDIQIRAFSMQVFREERK